MSHKELIAQVKQIAESGVTDYLNVGYQNSEILTKAADALDTAQTVPEVNEWKDAVTDALVVAHILTPENAIYPRKAVQDVIDWNCQVALDPRVSLEAQALVDSGKLEPVNAVLVSALEAVEKLEHEALVALSEATYELKVGNTYTTATDTYKANNDLIHRLDKVLNLQYRDRKRTALAAAKQSQGVEMPEPFYWVYEAGTPGGYFIEASRQRKTGGYQDAAAWNEAQVFTADQLRTVAAAARAKALEALQAENDVQTKAANHWMAEANTSHNLSVKQGAEIEALQDDALELQAKLEDASVAAIAEAAEVDRLKAEVERLTTLAHGQHIELYNARLQLAAAQGQSWSDDQMIRFAWLILNRQNDDDSIEHRLNVFRERELSAPIPQQPKAEPVLQVVNGELCYKSTEDDQSFGMWCPVTPDYHPPFKNGSGFYAAPQPKEPK